MSKQLQVKLALKALIQAALPGAEVIGPDGDEEIDERIPDGGRALLKSGDPGDPEIILSPLTYIYDHRFPLEITAYPTAGQTGEQVVDAMAEAIGDLIEADRSLGGLCDFLDAYAPSTQDIYVEGGAVARGSDGAIIATYATNRPL